jgi:glycosyltransferase involved in cell wall biosynthesis
MLQCHCLLLVQPNQAPHAIGAKTYEYLRAQRPILALVPAAGDAAQLVEECEAGEVVDPDNIQDIAQAILSMHTTFRSGRVTAGKDPSRVKRFERRTQAGRLATLFNDVAEGSCRPMHGGTPG